MANSRAGLVAKSAEELLGEMLKVLQSIEGKLEDIEQKVSSLEFAITTHPDFVDPGA